MARFNLDELTRHASGRWMEIFLSATSDANLHAAAQRRGKQVSCPTCGGNTRFRFTRESEQKGRVICNHCGSAFEFKALQLITGWKFGECAKFVANFLGLDPSERNYEPKPLPTPKAQILRVNLKMLNRLKETRAQCLSLDHPLASPLRQYLVNRGIGQAKPFVGFHPSLSYWDVEKRAITGKHPAMVTDLIDPKTGEAVSLHRTYLSYDGKKANVAKPKMVMAAAIEGVMGELSVAAPLFPLNGETLAVTEGIETACAVHLMTGLPAWATYSNTSLEKFRPPSGIARVAIYGDCDSSGAGQKSAAKLARELQKLGIASEIRLPVDASTFMVPIFGSYHRGEGIDEDTRELGDILRTHGYRVQCLAPTLRPNDAKKWPDWLDVFNQNKEAVKSA